MSELIVMCVHEEERLKVEKLIMTHLTIMSPSKKSFKKDKDKKKKWGNDAFHNGKKDENKIQWHLCYNKCYKRKYCFDFYGSIGK